MQQGEAVSPARQAERHGRGVGPVRGDVQAGVEAAVDRRLQRVGREGGGGQPAAHAARVRVAAARVFTAAGAAAA